MTEQTKSVIDDMDDLELIISMLNGHLDPERVAAVVKRLEEDAEFREFAAPMLLTWSVPKYIERHPRPEAETEAAWERFKRRPGVAMGHPAPEPVRRRRSWKQWLALFVVGFIGLVGVYTISVIAYGYTRYKLSPEPRMGMSGTDVAYTSVPGDTGWIALDRGVAVRLEPGAQLLVATTPVRGRKHVRLSGDARFVVTPVDTTPTGTRGSTFTVETRAGSVYAGDAEFTVSTRADTSIIRVIPPPRTAGTTARTSINATTEFDHSSYGTQVIAGEGVRLVTGRKPSLLAPLPTR